MKRSLIIITILFLLCIRIYSQAILDTDGLNNLNNVYLYSLKIYCESIDSIHTKVVYVMKDNFIGDSWPKEIKSTKIKYLENNKDYRKVIKENGGNVTIVRICNLEYENDNFYVSVIPFSTTYKKRRINFSNGGGLTVFFEHNFEKKGLIYKTKKWTGI